MNHHRGCFPNRTSGLGLRLARPVGLVMVAVAVALLLPAMPGAAQDESGQFIEFPFRDSDGNMVWYARAQRGEHMYGLVHPLKPTVRTHAYVFERHPEITGREAERTSGVFFVLPVRRRDAESSGRPDDAARVIAVMADRARFFPEFDLLEFTGVRMEVRYSHRSARGGGMEGAIADGPVSEGDGRPRGLGPELTTSRLFIRWEKRGGTAKFAHIFTDADFTLNAPEQDVVINRGTGFDTNEAEDFRTVTIERNVDGSFSRMPLAIGSPGGVASYEGTRFACAGRCTISFNRGFTQLVERIEMNRDVVLAQGAGRRLQCRQLEVQFAPGAQPEDPMRISRIVAREQVNLIVPGNFRALVGLLVTRYDEDSASTRLTAVMKRVVRLQLWADGGDSSSFVGAHVDDATGPAGVPPTQHVRTRIDADARDRVVLRSVRYKAPGPDDPTGRETWELVGQARMERWVQAEAREREPESDVPDFGVRIGREAIREGWTPSREPEETGRREIRPWQLSAVLNGAGSAEVEQTERAGSNRAGEDGASPDDDIGGLLATAPVHPDIVTPTGAIVLGFDLQSAPVVPVAGGARPVARDLRSLFVHNPGNVPVMELYVDQPGYGVRFFSTRFDVSRDVLPDGRVQEQTVFTGTNPHIIWLTTRNIDPFAMLERRAARANAPPPQPQPTVPPQPETEPEPEPEPTPEPEPQAEGETVPDDAVADPPPVEGAEGVESPDPDSTRVGIDDRRRPGARPHAGSGLPVFRYSVRGEREITLRQYRNAETGVADGYQFIFPGATRVQKSLWTGSGVDATRQAFDCQCRDLDLLFESRFAGQLETTRVRALPMIGGQVVITLGRDRCVCNGFRYQRRPAGPDASPVPKPNGNGEVPVPWIDTLHLDGPVELTLRDRATTGLLPFTGIDGQRVTAAWVQATSQRRVRLRTLLMRSTADPERVESRSLELLGPCELRALADDPDLTPSDETPRLLARMSGHYLRAETISDVVDAEPFERIERLWMAGNVEWDYRLQGLIGGGQRVEYRHDPFDSSDPLPRLRLSGDPYVRYNVTAGTRRGVGRVVFNETSNPVERANRYIELIGEPDTIRVRPRAGLEWTDEDGNRLTMFADRIDVGVLRGEPAEGQMTLATRALRSARGMLGGGRGVGTLRFRELRGIGNVVIRQAEEEARGDEFRWVDDLRGQRTGELIGRDPRFTGNSTGNVNFDLANLDTPADGGIGAAYRYRDHDPGHPERRNIITAEGRERMRLRLRIPQDGNQ